MYRRPTITVNDNLREVRYLLNQQTRYVNSNQIDTDYLLRSIISANWNISSKHNYSKLLKVAFKKNHIYRYSYIKQVLEKIVKKSKSNKSLKAILDNMNKKLSTRTVYLSKDYQPKISVEFIYASKSNIRVITAYDIAHVLNTLEKELAPKPIKVGLPKPPKMHMVHMKVSGDDCNFYISNE